MSVTRIRLSDLIVIKNGKDHQALSQGPYPVYGSGGVMRYVSEYLYDGEAVLLPRKGTLSNIQYAKGKFWTVDTTYYAIVNKNKADTYFLYHLLNHLDLSGLDSGASIPSMTARTYYSIKIDLPDLTTQKRIANILSTYGSLIEANNRRIELMEQTAQELYKEWFVRFRFPGHENAKFEDGFPQGWTIKRLTDYGRVETGKTPSTEIAENYGGEILFVKTPDMHDNMFIIQTEDKLSERGHGTQPKKLLPPNSIMVSCIGTASVVSINAELAHTNQQINSIVLNNPNELEWLYYTCKSLKKTIELFGSTGATMTNLSKGKFEKLKVINPGEELILSYHDKVKSLFDEIKSLMYQNLNLVAQRDMLLPRLMSGKLEV